jgi:hypothetical protein
VLALLSRCSGDQPRQASPTIRTQSVSQSGLRRCDDSRQDRRFPDGTRKLRHLRGAEGENEDLVVWEVPLQLVPRWLNRRRSRGNVIDLRIYAGLYCLEQTI